MIWHIFKKDWKLLWPLILLVALIHVAAASLSLILGHFNEPSELITVGRVLFPLVALFGVTVLTVLAVHQDRIPGETQDWLIRPILRRDLFLAKLLFVLVAVQGPLFAIDAAQLLWAGFPPAQSLGAALAQGATVFCSLSLPALLLGSVTRTMTQAIFTALGLVVLTGVLVTLNKMLGQEQAPFARSGLLWMRLAGLDLLAVLATIFVLPPLFARRHLVRARMVIAGVAALVVVSSLVPWRPLFAVQRWLSPEPEAGRGIALAFDPRLGRSKEELPPSVFAGNGGADAVLLPLRISGLTQGSMLFLDRAEIRLIGPNGTVLYRGVSWLSLDGAGPMAATKLEVHQTSRGDVHAHQVLFFRPRDFARIKDRTVRLEIDYSLTQFRARGTQHIAALGGDARLADAGWCKTRMDPEGDDVELACLTPADPPGCLTAVLENPATALHNPPYHACEPDYKPWSASIFAGVMRFGGGLPFRDLHGLAHYPVNGTQLNQAEVALQFFSPQAHFTRHLTMPAIRLSDWETEPRQTAMSGVMPRL
jgi:hypothetical protein